MNPAAQTLADQIIDRITDLFGDTTLEVSEVIEALERIQETASGLLETLNEEARQ